MTENINKDSQEIIDKDFVQQNWFKSNSLLLLTVLCVFDFYLFY